MILTLKHNDRIITGQEELTEVVDNFYDDLFGHAPVIAHSLDLDKVGNAEKATGAPREAVSGTRSGEGSKSDAT